VILYTGCRISEALRLRVARDIGQAFLKNAKQCPGLRAAELQSSSRTLTMHATPEARLEIPGLPFDGGRQPPGRPGPGPQFGRNPTHSVHRFIKGLAHPLGLFEQGQASTLIDEIAKGISMSRSIVPRRLPRTMPSLSRKNTLPASLENDYPDNPELGTVTIECSRSAKAWWCCKATCAMTSAARAKPNRPVLSVTS